MGREVPEAAAATAVPGSRCLASLPALQSPVSLVPWPHLTRGQSPGELMGAALRGRGSWVQASGGMRRLAPVLMPQPGPQLSLLKGPVPGRAAEGIKVPAKGASGLHLPKGL